MTAAMARAPTVNTRATAGSKQSTARRSSMVTRAKPGWEKAPEAAAAAAADVETPRGKQGELRKLGDSDLMVSEVCLGSMTWVGFGCHSTPGVSDWLYGPYWLSCQLGYRDHSGCHKLMSATIRPARGCHSRGVSVWLRGPCFGCHRLNGVFTVLQHNAKRKVPPTDPARRGSRTRSARRTSS
jgi:hypothetical protein